MSITCSRGFDVNDRRGGYPDRAATDGTHLHSERTGVAHDYVEVWADCVVLGGVHADNAIPTLELSLYEPWAFP